MITYRLLILLTATNSFFFFVFKYQRHAFDQDIDFICYMLSTVNGFLQAIFGFKFWHKKVAKISLHILIIHKTSYIQLLEN